MSGILPGTGYRVVKTNKQKNPVPTLMQLIVELGDGHKTNNHTNESIITNWYAFPESK